MSKFMLNGKPYGGSTNYASSVACTDAEGNESTVQAEIDKINNHDTYTVSGMTFHKVGNNVDVYGYLTDIGTTSTKTLESITKGLPINSYTVIPVYSSAEPYSVIGSLWIRSNGVIQIYKPSASTSAYVSGSYVCKD